MGGSDTKRGIPHLETFSVYSGLTQRLIHVEPFSIRGFGRILVGERLDVVDVAVLLGGVDLD
jgi:hypothetical protein